MPSFSGETSHNTPPKPGGSHAPVEVHRNADCVDSERGRRRSPVDEIWRHYGISSATCYKWKAKYGGLEASDVKRLKELEHENSRLKRMYADLSLENLDLKGVIEKSSMAR